MRGSEKTLTVTLLSLVYGWSDKQIADALNDDITAIRQDVIEAHNQFKFSDELSPKQREARIFSAALAIGKTKVMTGAIDALTMLNEATRMAPMVDQSGLIYDDPAEESTAAVVLRATNLLKAYKDGINVLAMLDKIINVPEVESLNKQDESARSRSVLEQLIAKSEKDAKKYLTSSAKDNKRISDKASPDLIAEVVSLPSTRVSEPDNEIDVDLLMAVSAEAGSRLN